MEDIVKVFNKRPYVWIAHHPVTKQAFRIAPGDNLIPRDLYEVPGFKQHFILLEETAKIAARRSKKAKERTEIPATEKPLQAGPKEDVVTQDEIHEMVNETEVPDDTEKVAEEKPVEEKPVEEKPKRTYKRTGKYSKTKTK